MRESVVRMVQECTEEERLILCLRYEHGCSQSEIDAILRLIEGD